MDSWSLGGGGWVIRTLTSERNDEGEGGTRVSPGQPGWSEGFPEKEGGPELVARESQSQPGAGGGEFQKTERKSHARFVKPGKRMKCFANGKGSGQVRSRLPLERDRGEKRPAKAK